MKTAAKDKNQDKPWVSNYPPLANWLERIEARCLQQTILSRDDEKKEPTAYLETWMANGRVFLVEVRGSQHGWNIYTGTESNSIQDTLKDADARLGLAEGK